MRTGTVYKTLGFGLDEGHFSRVSRRDSGSSPSASVSISGTRPSDSALAGHRVEPRMPKIKLAYHVAVQRPEYRNHTTVAQLASGLFEKTRRITCGVPAYA